MRYLSVVVWLLLCPVTSAVAQISIEIGLPSVRIGIDLPVYPELVAVPGYPVYYAPGIDSNYFFYDGFYWVYLGDNWYASSWYNGPWALVAPEVVPVFILRVPVRYYRQPPSYFRGWGPDGPPRWGEHWGNDWERRHGGWDKWNRNEAPAPAPLPVYQKQYSGDRYPRPEQQQTLHREQYRYEPHDTVVRQAYQKQGLRGGSPPSPRGGRDRSEPPARSPEQPAAQRSPTPAPRPDPATSAPGKQPPRAPEREQAQQRPPEREQARPGKAGAPETKGGAQQPKEKSGPSQGEERGQGHDRPESDRR